MAVEIPRRSAGPSGRRAVNLPGPENVPTVSQTGDPGLSVPQGAFGADLSGIGESLSGAFEPFAQAAEKQQIRQDYIATTEAKRKFKKEVDAEWQRRQLEDPASEDGFRRPADPGFRKDFVSFVKQKRDEILGGLEISKDERELFTLELDGMVSSYDDAAGSLHLQASQNKALGLYDTTSSELADDVFKDPTYLNDALEVAEVEVSKIKDILTPEAEQKLIETTEKQLVESAISAYMINGDFQNAKAVLDENSSLFTVAERETKYTRQRRAITAEVESMLPNHLASIEQTGVGVPGFQEKAENVLQGEAKAAFRNQVRDAREYFEVVTDFKTATPEEIITTLEGLKPSPGSRTFKADSAKHQAAVTAATTILKERSSDPAGSVIKTDPTVASAFDAFQESPSPQAYNAYKVQLEAAYESQGYPDWSRPALPKKFREGIVSQINHEAGNNFEVAADQINSLAISMGDDWIRAQGELEQAGLDPMMVAAGLLTDSPAMQNELVLIAQNGGMSALKERVPKDDRDVLDDEVGAQFEQAFRLAGGPNARFMGSMYETARTLAYSMESRGVSDPADKAVEAVLSRNFQPVEEPRISGLVDADILIDPEVVGAGAEAWFEANLTEPEEPQTVNQESIIVEDKGKFYAVPTVIDGNRIPDFAAENMARQRRFLDTNGRKLPSFESREAAEAGLTGEVSPSPVLNINPSQANAFKINMGMRDEDVQSVARMVLENGGRFELTPDGKSAVLVENTTGVPQAILDMEGKPITVSVEELKQLGNERLGRIQREKGMGPVTVPTEIEGKF